MLRRFAVIFLTLIWVIQMVSAGCALAARPVKVSPVVLNTTAPDSVNTLVIDDYEDGNLVNHFSGESGTWNLTPENEEVQVSAGVVETAGAEGARHILRLTYALSAREPTKAGFWTKLMGLDATQFDHLAFEVRGDSEAGFTATFLVELKKPKDEARIDKIKGTHVVSHVTDKWQTIEIPLNLFTGLFDQTNPEAWKNPMLARKDLDELVINLESRRVTALKGALYFDDFRLIRKGEPGMTVMDQPTQSVMKTPVRLEGVEFMNFLVKRLSGFPKEVHPKKEFPKDDREFLMAIARDTWRFFDHIVDHQNHLPLDTIQMGSTEPVSEGGWVGDYTNVTNIGLYLMCLVSAYDLGFLSREEAISRIRATLGIVEHLAHHESGFLYNYYDTTTRARTSYFVSLVDSGWLDAGIYVVKNAFPEEMAEQANWMLSSHNFSFFYDTVEQQFSHGFYAHLNLYSDYHYGSLYTEPRATSLIAIGRGDVPEEHWFALVRTFPEEYPWQTQMPIHRELKTTLGHQYYGGYYEWKAIPFMPSWGGSMFEVLMPTLIIDEAKYAPLGLGLSNANYVKIHMKYTLEELKYPVWGMSPSSVPEGGYSEFGVQVLGAKGYKSGVVTPHASILALEYAPKEVIQNLRELVRRYPIYGEYGFYDAVTVSSGLVAQKYLALDQAMILIALNNYLNKGAIRNRFHSDPIGKKILPLLSEEHFFENSQTSAT